MTDQHLRELLEDASAHVPRRDMAAVALTGAARRRRRRRAGALASLAAAGVAVAAMVQGPALLPGDDGDGLVATEPGAHGHVAERAPVEDDFECENTLAAPAPDMPEIYGSGPDLGVGNLGASRYQIVSEGDHEVLEVGDAEGNLTARVNLVPGKQGPTIGAYERCTGPRGDDLPVADRFDLGTHGRPMPDPPNEIDQGELMSPRITSSVVPVDDRPYFNRIGVVEHRTIYAYETTAGAGFSFVERGRLAGSVSWDRAGSARDILGPNFIPYGDPDPSVVDFGFAGWAYYATEDVTLTGRLSDGTRVEAEEFRADDWKGTLHVLLAPLAELEQVALERADGQTRVFDPGDS